MKRALYGVLTALPTLITAIALSIWYFGISAVMPFVLIAAALWFFAIFRPYEMLQRGGRIFLIAALWIVAAAAWASPYAVIWLAFQGGHHI